MRPGIGEGWSREVEGSGVVERGVFDGRYLLSPAGDGDGVVGDCAPL